MKKYFKSLPILGKSKVDKNRAEDGLFYFRRMIRKVVPLFNVELRTKIFPLW